MSHRTSNQQKLLPIKSNNARIEADQVVVLEKTPKKKSSKATKAQTSLIVVVWKGIHYRSDTNKTGAEGFSFYYPRLLYFPDQMMAVILLSQHPVSSSKTVRPRAPCGTRSMGHTIRTWSAVCSGAPHWQFSEGTRLYLCMDEWNSPTPVLKQLSLTQAARDKPIPTGLPKHFTDEMRHCQAQNSRAYYNQ